MDGFLTEFKNISGGENALSHRFREALRQGVNVYLKIDSEITVKRIRQILRGVLLQKDNAGLVYCYLSLEKTMYCWKMIDLKKIRHRRISAFPLPQAGKSRTRTIKI